MENKPAPKKLKRLSELKAHKCHAVRMEMENLSGRTSVPQIFFDGEHMGGYDDIKNLDIKRLLNAS